MKNMDKKSIKGSPETIREMTIHLEYMRDDMSHIKKMLESGHFVEQKTFTDFIEAASAEHESMRGSIRSLEEFRSTVVGRIAAGAIVILVAMVLALYGLDQFI